MNSLLRALRDRQRFRAADRSPVSESRRWDPGNRGQSLVEFAIILPVVLFLLLGALDLGRVFYAQITLENAAKEAALVASQGGDATGAAVAESQGSGVQVTAAEVTVGGSACEGATFGQVATVGIAARFDIITPIIGDIFRSQNLMVRASAQAQCEVVPPFTPAATPGPTPPPTPTPAPTPTPTPVAGDPCSPPTGGHWTFDSKKGWVCKK